MIVACVASILYFVHIVTDMTTTTPPKVPPQMLQYFNIVDTFNLTWAHAVNSPGLLRDALVDPSVMMLEADVMMDAVANVPVMAHPPATTSDLTLEEFLQTVGSSTTMPKGVKLDYKTTSALTNSLQIVKEFILNDEIAHSNGTMNRRPVIINADILQGPNSDPAVTPVDKKLFIDVCNQLPSTIVSPGWTTGFSESHREGYQWDSVREMYELVKDLPHSEITFPVRISLAAVSADQLLWLIGRERERFSLTLWTSHKDYYDFKELSFLKGIRDRVYFDLPDKEREDVLSLLSSV